MINDNVGQQCGDGWVEKTDKCKSKIGYDALLLASKLAKAIANKQGKATNTVRKVKAKKARVAK